ncbi:MAG: S8 family serine peptidase [Promethearchaeota archaeon]
MKKKKTQLAGKIVLGLVLGSIGLGIPTYYIFFHQGSPMINVDLMGHPDREFFQWESISLNWSITVNPEAENKTAYSYSAYLDEETIQSSTNVTDPSLEFSVGPFSPGNHTFRILVTDFQDTSNMASNSTLLQIVQDADSDGDLLYDHEELWQYYTDPAVVDTDEDGLTDGDEVLTYGTDPLSNDTDGDSILDNVEIFTYMTDPLLADTDEDGLTDDAELFHYLTNPLTADSDGDGSDDFSEIYFSETDPLINDTSPIRWEGGTILVRLEFQPDQPHFVPEYVMSVSDTVKLPRKLYLYIIDQTQLAENGNRTFFYIHSLIRLDPLRILVIDYFNSTELDDRVHGTTCVNIVEETISAILGSTNARTNFTLFTYSVFEEDRSWGTALDYAIATGVDVISLSQVASYGSTAYFDNFSTCISDYRMVICTGSGNDNRGDPNNIGVNTLRYPSLHPDTLVVGGILYNTNLNQWERWNEGASLPGSNWGRSSMTYNSTEHFSALELVANCERTILFQEYYGVSWAIPQISGFVATILWKNPYLTPSTVRTILLSTATQINPSRYTYGGAPFTGGLDGWNAEVGYGLPNAEAALFQAAETHPFP